MDTPLQVENRAIQAIKNTAINFEIEQYFTDRTTVEADFKKAVAEAISPMFVELRHFFLANVSIPASVSSTACSGQITGPM